MPDGHRCLCRANDGLAPSPFPSLTPDALRRTDTIRETWGLRAAGIGPDRTFGRPVAGSWKGGWEAEFRGGETQMEEGPAMRGDGQRMGKRAGPWGCGCPQGATKKKDPRGSFFQAGVGVRHARLQCWGVTARGRSDASLCGRPGPSALGSTSSPDPACRVGASRVWSTPPTRLRWIAAPNTDQRARSSLSAGRSARPATLLLLRTRSDGS